MPKFTPADALPVRCSVTSELNAALLAHDWGDLHLLALASGAVICHILIGLLAYTQTTADRIGLIVLGLAMIGWLAWLAFHIHSRIFSQDRSVKKR